MVLVSGGGRVGGFFGYLVVDVCMYVLVVEGRWMGWDTAYCYRSPLLLGGQAWWVVDCFSGSSLGIA